MIILVLFFGISLPHFFHNKKIYLTKENDLLEKRLWYMNFIFETYHETYKKPTNLLKSSNNSAGNACVGKKWLVKWLIKINNALRVN